VAKPYSSSYFLFGLKMPIWLIVTILGSWMGLWGEGTVWLVGVEIGEEDGLREGEAGGGEGKCGLAVDEFKFLPSFNI